MRVARVVDTGDVRAVGLGKLHGNRADASRSAVDQDSRPGGHPSLRQIVQGDEPGGRHRGRLFKADAGGLQRHPLLGGGGVLGERTAVAPLDTANGLTEDLVTRLEPGHRAPDGLHHAGDVSPGHSLAGTSDPGAHKSKDRGPTGYDVPYIRMHGRCLDPD